MQVADTALREVKRVVPPRVRDARGFFSETYNKRRLAEHGIALDFVQDNLSFSARQGTVRGLHFQAPPRAQAKLVSVLTGAVLDVAVDLRKGSPTFGRHVAIKLTAEEGAQLFVPVGFAHGYCTIDPETLVFYKVSDVYSPEHDRGVLWNDPALGIAWPVEARQAVVSDKDSALPPLAALPDYFVYRPDG